MCLEHPKAISLLSNSTQKGLFPAGHYVQIPYGKWLWAFSSNFGSVCIPHKAWLCFWSPGEAERGISHKFVSVHLDWVMDAVPALPADHWCGKKSLLPAKYRCTALLLQPAYDRHPRNEGNTPWAVIRPRGLILLPFFLYFIESYSLF